MGLELKLRNVVDEGRTPSATGLVIYRRILVHKFQMFFFFISLTARPL